MFKAHDQINKFGPGNIRTEFLECVQHRGRDER